MGFRRARSYRCCLSLMNGIERALRGHVRKLHGHITEELHIRITKTDWSEPDLITPSRKGIMGARGKTPAPQRGMESEQGSQRKYDKGAATGAQEPTSSRDEALLGEGEELRETDDCLVMDQGEAVEEEEGGKERTKTSFATEGRGSGWKQRDIRQYFRLATAWKKSRIIWLRGMMCRGPVPAPERPEVPADKGYQGELLAQMRERDGDDGALGFEQDEELHETPDEAGTHTLEAHTCA